MKPYVYVVCFCLLALIGLDSCSKSNDPVAASPVVGRWELNRGLLSSFPTSTTSNINGSAVDLYYISNYGSTIDVYADNTFNENYRQLFVDDVSGNWTFNSNTLTLNYDQGGADTYTYSKNKNIEELAITTPSNYTTASGAVGKIQLIYRK